MDPDELSQLCVADIMSRWPQTITVFMELHMYCVGCPIGIFHTIEDAALEHGLEQAELLARIEAAIGPIPDGDGLRRSAPAGAAPSPEASAGHLPPDLPPPTR